MPWLFMVKFQKVNKFIFWQTPMQYGNASQKYMATIHHGILSVFGVLNLQSVGVVNYGSNRIGPFMNCVGFFAGATE